MSLILPRWDDDAIICQRSELLNDHIKSQFAFVDFRHCVFDIDNLKSDYLHLNGQGSGNWTSAVQRVLTELSGLPESVFRNSNNMDSTTSQKGTV